MTETDIKQSDTETLTATLLSAMDVINFYATTDIHLEPLNQRAKRFLEIPNNRVFVEKARNQQEFIKAAQEFITRIPPALSDFCRSYENLRNLAEEVKKFDV